MKTQTDPKQSLAKLAVMPGAKTAQSLQAQVALEQMYGYFSFDPMPMEAVDQRRAA